MASQIDPSGVSSKAQHIVDVSALKASIGVNANKKKRRSTLKRELKRCRADQAKWWRANPSDQGNKHEENQRWETSFTRAP